MSVQLRITVPDDGINVLSFFMCKIWYLCNGGKHGKTDCFRDSFEGF